MKQVLLCAFLLFGLSGIHLLPAQSFPQLAKDENPNYFEVQRKILDFWAGKDPGKGNGWKVFKRWEDHWKDRILPDGSFPPADINQIEMRKYLEKHKNSSSADVLTAANWTNLGTNSSSGGYSGIGRIMCIAFHPTNTSIIWVGTPAGGLWKSTNNGTSWTTSTDNFASLGVSSIVIDPVNANIMYIATGDPDGGDTHSTGVLKSTDGGLSWNTTGLSWSAGQYRQVHQMIVHPTSTSTLLAATSDGLYRTTNGGSSWTKVRSGEHYDVKFKPGTPSTVYATTGESIYRSTDGGVTWTLGATISGSARVQIAVSANNTSVVVAVSSSGSSSFNGLYSSTNSGVSFTLKSSSPNLLNGSADGTGGGGQGWYDLCISVSPTNASIIYVGGVNLWKSTNGGTSWTLVNYWNGAAPPGASVVHADKHCLAWQNNSNLFQGCDGGIYRSTNAGTSWTDISNGLVISQMYRLGVSKADNKVICGLQDNGTKLYSNPSWSDEIGGDGMECFIHPTNANIMYGEIQNGELRRSTDGGNVWDDIQNNIPNAPVGAWVTPWTLDPNNGTILYAGYNEVWKSTNQGNSWTAISADFGLGLLSLLAVAPSNSNTIYTGVYNKIYRSTNGGNSWSNVTGNLPVSTSNITYLAIDPTNSNQIYITLGNYSAGQKVYKSTSGGSTWTNISGTLPNLPANCITYQTGSSEGLYVGMDVGVYYRNSSMSDWVLYNTGLPNVIVKELEIKTSTGKIRAATYGRGLWESNVNTTNSLTVTPSVQNVTSPAGSTTFSVAANVSWTASDNASWLSLSPTSGTGNATLTATFTANTGAASRSATITVTGGGITKTVTVTQAIAVINSLTVTPSVQNVTSPAGSTTFSVAANVSWTASDNASWLSLSPTSGTGNATLTATFTANTGAASRSATITVTGGGITKTVTVTQAIAVINSLTVTPSVQNVASPAGSTTFSVAANVSWTASDNASWLSLSPTSGTGNATLTATFTANTGAASRSATITVTGGGITKTVTVTQAAQANSLTVTPSVQNVTASAGSTTFIIAANVSWTASDNATWLNLAPISGSGNATLTATFTANTGTTTRTATITVVGGGITETVTVVQTSNSTGCSNDNEPANNAIGSAPFITLSTNRLSQIGTPSDVDHWRFTISGNNIVIIRLTNLPDDYDLALLNSSGSVVYSSTNSGLQDEYMELALSAGTYYAQVYGYGGVYNASLCYTLRVAAAALGNCINGDEPANNGYATAPTMAMNSYKYSQIGAATDGDLWKFNVSNSSQIYLDLFNMVDDYDLRLYDSGGVLITESTNPVGESEFISTYLYTGTYYAWIFGYNGAYNTNLCYVLEVANSDWLYLTGTSEDRAGANDFLSLETGDLVIFPNPTTGKLDLQLPGDEPYQVSITDAMGRQVLIQEIQYSATIDLTTQQEGIYYLTAFNQLRHFARKIMLLRSR